MRGARETRATFIHVPAAMWINRPAATQDRGFLGARLATGLGTAIALVALLFVTSQDGLSDSGTTAWVAGASAAAHGNGPTGYLPDLFGVPADAASDQPATF